MLELRPNCECCDKDLPNGAEAFICTFCAACAGGVFQGRCPNCGGDLQRRPTRPAKYDATHPSSTRRVLKPHRECAPV